MIIPNQSNIAFNYVLPDGQTIAANLDSNVVNTEILTYSVPKVKTGDKTFLQEGETSQHTVVITNNSQTRLFDLVFKDTMSNGATYVAGSVTVNGVAQPTYDPVAGFALPALDPGQSVTVDYTIQANNPMSQSPVTNYATLDYTVDDPIRGNVSFTENTNTVSVQIISNRITNVKSVDKAYAVQGDTLHYTSVITNTGSLLKSDLVFTDPIPAGTTFVSGSVNVNGINYAAYDPQTGFALPDLAVGDSVTIEFDVTVN
ncbi:MAG: DUF11 domain-containing protein [Clostridiales bacterium]|nr:DUF11 domain-containing protein [Clostridiales bacterium]